MEDTSGSREVQAAVDPEVYQMWRKYRLCDLMHCTPLELEEQPAVLLDWFMEFSSMEQDMQQAQIDKETR